MAKVENPETIAAPYRQAFSNCLNEIKRRAGELAPVDRDMLRGYIAEAPIEMEQERAQEPAPEGIQENAKDTRNMMQKLSSALWDAFEGRMKPSK